MPTQEELNAAQVELDIANDNYAQLANRYNQYQKLFQEYAKSSPEIQNKAANAMGRALEDFYQIQEKMRTAEDRIAVAQNAVNNYNSIIANQPQQTIPSQPIARRRTVTPTQIIPNTAPDNTVQPVGDWTRYVPNQNMLRINGVNTQPAIISPAPTVPYEIQNVRNLRGNDYLQGLKNLEDNYGYNVIGQRAYRNGESYRTY